MVKNCDQGLENAADESQAENRPMPMQEAEIRWQKVSLVGHYVC